MTTSSATSPPTGAATVAPRLERPRDSAFRGVCAAVARSTGTDPVLWRVLVVVLTLFSGLGVLLYLGGIVAIPREGEERSLADRLLNGPDRHLSGRQTLLLVLLVVLGLAYVGNPNHLVVTVVAVAIGFLLWRGRHDGSHARAEIAVQTGAPAVPVAAPVWTAPPPRPPRPRSPLGGVTAGLAAVTAGVLVLVGVSGASIPTEVVLAAALGVVGIGLVAGSFLGRSWSLVLLAGALLVALAATVSVRPVIDDGVGDRTWTPTTSSSYRLGIGEGTLDLRTLRENATVKAHLEVGHLLVLVPAGTGVVVDAKAGLGDVNVFGKEVNGRQKSAHVTTEGTGPTIRLDLSVRTGYVEVRHV
ncbi:MAG: PspC domain protein [Frankiales bacterium]|nr:PspC domain protein [Frankiales bacterium]